MEDFKVNGTLIWYYHICKREVWLMARNITPDQDDKFLDIARFIHENSYSRDKKEVSIGNIKVDIIRKRDGSVLVGEMKKSSKFAESARMQLAYYLYKLNELGINAEGVLMFPKERKRVEVILDEDLIKEITMIEDEIINIVHESLPSKPIKIGYCKNCAYGEFCWS